VSNDESEKKQEVTVTDIRMPFGSMVLFMVKWAVASIPALIKPASARRCVLYRPSAHRRHDRHFLVRHLLFLCDALARRAEFDPVPSHRRKQRRRFADGRSVAGARSFGPVVPQPALRLYSQPDPQGVSSAPAGLGD